VVKESMAIKPTDNNYDIGNCPEPYMAVSAIHLSFTHSLLIGDTFILIVIYDPFGTDPEKSIAYFYLCCCIQVIKIISSLCTQVAFSLYIILLDQ